MANIEFSHEIIERRQDASKLPITVRQEMIVKCDYNPEEDSVGDIEVHLYENGKHVAEISKLLSKAEGDPLTAMIETINWREIYRNSLLPAEEY